MADISTLTPIIAGATMFVGGLATLFWLDRTKPQLRVPARDARPEEEAPDPFDVAPVWGGGGENVFGRLFLKRHRKRKPQTGEVTTKVPTESSASYAPRFLAEADKD